MKSFKKISSVILVFILLFINLFGNFTLNTSAAAVTTLYIEGSNVRVRTQPNLTTSEIIEEVSHTSATVLETVKSGNDTWYKITYYNGSKQITGYVKYDSKYIRVVTFNPDASFEEKLNAFPASYRDALRSLHAVYPNWEFIPDPVNLKFSEAVAQQSINMRKQVNFSSQKVSWRSMGQGSYDWSKGEWITTNGGWTGASKEVIAYFMDPRNFLNSSSIYQFLQQGYNSSTQTEAGLLNIIKGTFLEVGYTSNANDTYAVKNADGVYIGSYSKIIMAAAKQSNVSPYIIASKIIQEQGINGNSSIISGSYSGYEGYYNFFNVGASGTNSTAVITNGLERAKKEGWSSRAASIIGGAEFLSDGYISDGQDTYYYQDFNVHNTDRLWHQYAQAVHDAYNKGVSLAKTYKDETSYTLDFKIPVFLDMPESVSERPAENSNKNNYYASSISVSGLTPSFSMYTNSYDLHLTSDTTVFVQPVSGAAYSGSASYKINKGTNAVNIGIKSETGYINNYTITVKADAACTLYVKTGEAPTTVIRGDTNGDGSITIRDLANVRLHLLGLLTLTDNNLSGADTNNDGSVTIRDLANIRLHLLGLSTIS